MSIIHLILKIKGIMDKFKEDHVTAFSAQSAFFILLSSFPFMIFFLTLVHYLPFSKSEILTALLRVVPANTKSTVMVLFGDMYAKANGTLLSISIITALWSASRGMLAITNGLNTIYDTDETRNYFVLRFFSMIYTLIFCIALILILAAFVFGNTLYQYTLKFAPWLSEIASLIMHFRMLVGTLVLVIFFLILYRFIPDRRGRLKYELPGAILSAFGWTAIAILMSIYVQYFGNFSYMYGSLAGVVVIMLWLYFSMILFFIGAEINHYFYPRRF